MENKPWWQSKTIWAALVAAIASGASLAGHNIDSGTQVVLVNNLTNIADGIAVLSGIAASIFRAKSTTNLTK